MDALYECFAEWGRHLVHVAVGPRHVTKALGTFLGSQQRRSPGMTNLDALTTVNAIAALAPAILRVRHWDARQARRLYQQFVAALTGYPSPPRSKRQAPKRARPEQLK